jgi:microcystin-dependent protein
MSYTLTWSDPSAKSNLTISSGGSDSSSTSFTLFGKGYPGWGQPIQNNLLHLLENFAKSSAPSAPTIGQLWFDTTTNVNHIKLYTSTGFQELAYRRIDAGSAPVIITYNGDIWYDTVKKYLNVFNGGWSALAYDVQTYGNYSLELAGSVANAYIVAVNPVITSYTHDFTGKFKVTHANTGPCTINAGGGALPLLTDTGAALASGDLQVGKIISYIYVQGTGSFYITSSVTSELITQVSGSYATVNGSSSQHFEVAAPVDGNSAISQSYANTNYAAVNGSASQHFEVAAPVDGNSAISQSYANTNYAPIFPSSHSLVPPGTLIDFCGPPGNVPLGWVMCPNIATIISISTYPNLFAAISNYWGGDGISTFGLPYFPQDYTSIHTTGSNAGSSTGGNVISHDHAVQFVLPNTNMVSTVASGGYPVTYSTPTASTTSPTGTSANFPAGMRVIKCVKV